MLWLHADGDDGGDDDVYAETFLRLGPLQFFVFFWFLFPPFHLFYSLPDETLETTCFLISSLIPRVLTFL